jgi:hypothetical protein
VAASVPVPSVLPPGGFGRVAERPVEVCPRRCCGDLAPCSQDSGPRPPVQWLRALCIQGWFRGELSRDGPVGSATGGLAGAGLQVCMVENKVCLCLFVLVCGACLCEDWWCVCVCLLVCVCACACACVGERVLGRFVGFGWLDGWMCGWVCLLCAYYVCIVCVFVFVCVVWCVFCCVFVRRVCCASVAILAQAATFGTFCPVLLEP